MINLGYKLCSEEQTPQQLIDCARRAEEVGFAFAMISDHFHPWTDRQGQSSFMWSMLGAISQATQTITIGTAVTCPIIRIHPAIIAQASATAACLLPGRFILGLGSGENLNEHIFGDHWPEADVRREMLAEALAVIRQLWQGRQVSHYGVHYTVENARIYTLPQSLPPVFVAASGSKSAKLAGQTGDGLIATSPKAELVKQFRNAGGDGKPCYAEMAVCWDEDEEQALHTAYEYWPNLAITGELSQQLPVPGHFQQAAQMIHVEDLATDLVRGNDPKPYLNRLHEYEEAGFAHVFMHQIGPDQDGFFRFCERELMPGLGSTGTRAHRRGRQATQPEAG
jgi:coenzyme F420-dependent glucose-6-phosphate dehydrogenase